MDSNHRSTRYKLVALAAKLLAQRFYLIALYYSVKPIHGLAGLLIEVVDRGHLRVYLHDQISNVIGLKRSAVEFLI